MKLKSKVDDFRVEERTNIVAAAGPFALYRLEKTNLTTLDAIATIRHRWHLDAQRISFGGLKDRHAATSQFLTVHHGPPRDLSDRNLKLSFVGHVAFRYTSENISSNWFRVVVRDLSHSDVELAISRIDLIRQGVVPNYFDDQRFGSVTGGEFIARLMILGQYEEAIRLALTAPYEFDKSAAIREKSALCEFWGRWDECLKRLPRGPARDIVAFLKTQPGNFRGAVSRLWPESQGLYLSAYQSHIWNKMLAEYVRGRIDERRRVVLPSKTGNLLAPLHVTATETDELLSMTLPLPSARLRYDPEAHWAPLVDAALADEGFPLSKMKLPGLREPFFSKGDRAAFVQPRELIAATEPDDMHPDRSKLVLEFELPRGSYATILIKMVTAPDLAAKNRPLA